MTDQPTDPRAQAVRIVKTAQEKCSGGQGCIRHVRIGDRDTIAGSAMIDEIEHAIKQAREGMISKTAYELCELENSNLRKCLVYAGERLPEAVRAEIGVMVRKPLDDGGVVTDGAEERAEELAEFQKLCVRAAEMLREGVDYIPVTDDDKHWCARADELAGKLMEYDPPSPEASLAEIRNTEEVT